MKADEFIRRIKPIKESWKIISQNAKIKEDMLNARFLRILS